MNAYKNSGLMLLIISIVFISFNQVVFAASKAPGFELQDYRGNTISLSDYQGKIVVIEWTNPDCPFVQRHYREETMKKLEKEYRDQDVVWLAVNSTHYMGKEENMEFAKENNIPYPILIDQSGEVGKSYGAQTTPHMYIIGKSGEIVYQGGIDDDPRGNRKPSERTQYVDNALEDVVSGQEVEVSSSKPYGCSVKYKK